VNLDPLVGKKMDFKNVKPSLLNSGRIKGKLYGIILGANTYVVMYDPALFKKAKLPEPNSNWTWKDYMNISRKIHKSLGIYGETALSFTYRNMSGLEHYVRQHGQKFFNGKKIGFDKKLFVDFYKMDLDLTKEGVFAPPEVRMELHTVENDLMITKKAAMAGYWTNQIVAITKAANRPIKMVLMPKAVKQAKEGTYLKPAMFFSITKDCKKVDAAAKFIDFFINDIEANKVLMADRGVPVSSNVQKAMVPFLNDPQKKMFEMVDYASEHASPMDPPPPPQYKQIIDLLTDINMKILYGATTLEKGAKEFIQKANAILAAK
jgi:multiple sugar transport system substrate-binding protein